MSAKEHAAETRRSPMRRAHGRAYFGGMSWPYDCEQWHELLHRARYDGAALTQTDLYCLCALGEAYFALIGKTATSRAAVVARLREAEADEAREIGGSRE